METKETIISISWQSIFKVLFSLFICYILYLTKEVFLLIFFSLIISILFEPLISFFQKKKIPRFLAITLTYIAFFVLLGLFIYWMLPIFVSESREFTKSFPQYFEKISTPLKNLGINSFENIEVFSSSIQNWLTNFSSNIFDIIVSFFGNIISIMAVFFLSFFFSIEKDELKKMIGLLIPKEKRGNFFDLWQRCQSRTIAWFGTRFLGGLFVGIATYFVLVFLNIKHDFAIAVLAGITNFVPFLGGIVTGIVLALVSLLDSWTKALVAVLIFTLIQQIEANVIMPISSKKFMGLPATLTLITLLIGGQLFGVLGAVLAVPFVGILYEFLKDLKNKKYV